MRHLRREKKFGRNSAQRRDMFNTMACSFLDKERIQTTTAKAKELRRLSEKIITRARENTLHNKRIVMKKIKDRDVIRKLFEDIGPRYEGVHGGYTRVIKLGRRKGDGAELSILELVDVNEIREKKPSKKTQKAAPKKQAAPKKPVAKQEGKTGKETAAKKAPSSAGKESVSSVKKGQEAGEKKAPSADRKEAATAKEAPSVAKKGTAAKKEAPSVAKKGAAPAKKAPPAAKKGAAPTKKTTTPSEKGQEKPKEKNTPPDKEEN